MLHLQPKTVFISRDLQPGSDFRRTLEKEGWKIRDHSLIQFSAIAQTSLPEAEWIFFTSSKGVEFFLRQFRSTKSMRVAALGPGTAQTLKNAGVTPEFIGTGAPAETAPEFVQLAENSSVLFPIALHSLRRMQELLGDRVRQTDLTVYENRIKEEISAETARILVFTSPLNAEAYFSRHRLLEGQQVLAIGATTAGALMELGILNVHTATQPQESDLAKTVLSIASGGKSG